MATNVPVTQWQDTQGVYEFTSDGGSYIVDTTGTFLVDPSATYIVDTGVIATLIPDSVWIENDGV